MIMTTAKIDGMMCSMCESHVNDMIRKNFKVQKVTSSHRKNEAYIVSQEAFTKEQLDKLEKQQQELMEQAARMLKSEG